jgi:hypothetical protein
MADAIDDKKDTKVSPADFWKPELGYDSSVFKQDRVHNGDFKRNTALRDSFISAAQKVYKMETGKESTLNNEKLIDWAINYQRDYDMQTVGITGHGSYFTSIKLKGAKDDERLAFRYLKDVYELYDDSTVSQIFSAATDATNLITIPISGGTSALLKFGASRILSGGATGAGAKAITWLSTRPQFVGSAIGAGLENAVTSNYDDRQRQNTSMIIGEQHEFNTARLWTATAVSAAFGSAAGVALGKLAGKVAPPAGTTGIALPEFETRTDYFKWWMRRNANPLKFFTNIAPVTNMAMESRPITRPVIAAVDGFMKEKGLLTGVKDVQDTFLREIANGGTGDTAIQNFITANTPGLDQFRTGVAELRKHVADTYKVVGPLRKTVFGEITHAIPGLAGEYGKTGLMADQKNALLHYLDDMIALADDLKNANGKNFNEMKKNAQKGMHNIAGFSDSLNGLSKAYADAYNAHMRLTGRTYLTDNSNNKVSVQWKDGLARSLQEGFYNNAHQTEVIPYKYARGQENIEMTWQNNILDFADKHIATKDKDGKITAYTWNSTVVPQFFGQLEAVELRGFGQEVLYSMDELMRRRHMWGGGDRNTLPPASDFRNYFQKQTKYLEQINGQPNPEFSKSYRNWADALIRKAVLNDTDEFGAALAWAGHLQRNRQNRHYYASASYPYRFTMRHPGTREDPTKLGLALPGFNYFWPYVSSVKFQLFHYFTGAKESKMVNDLITSGNSSGAYPKLVTTRKGEGETAAAVWRRAAVRIGTAGLIDDLHWNPLRMPSTFATRFVFPLTTAGLISTYKEDGELNWDNTVGNAQNYAGFKMMRLGLVTPKTMWGSVKGWWDADGMWNNKSISDGAINSGIGIVGGAASGLWNDGIGDVWDGVLGGTVPFPRFAIPTIVNGEIKSGGSKETKPDPAPAVSTAPPPQKEKNAQGGGEQKSTDLATKEKAREELRLFGRAVASLTNAIADDGKWTEGRQKEVAKLVKQRDELEAVLATLKLGNFAQNIFDHASDALKSQLLSNMTQGRPSRIATFQEVENARQYEYGEKVKKWYDQVRALNLDIEQKKSWSEESKKLPAKLKAEHDAFVGDVAFLRKDIQEIDKSGMDMLKTLIGAAEATKYGNVVRTTAPPADPAAEQQRLEEEKRKEAEAAAARQAAEEKANRDALAKQQRDGGGASGNISTPPGSGSSSSATTPPQTPGQVTPPKRTAPPAPGSEKSVGEHLGDVWNSFSEYTGIDNSGGSGGNSLGNAFGAAVSGGFSWLGNTYSHIKNKPGGGGRTVIRDVGAGIGAIVAASTLISPFWDKMWVGQIPIVGSLLKLGSVVVLFMLFRKGLNEMMDPAPPLEPAASVMQQDGGRATERRSYLPRFEEGQPVVHTQSHSGGTPSKSTVIYWDAADENAAKSIAIDMKAGKPVVQIRTDNDQIYISRGIVSQETVTQSAAQIKGNINVPFDRLNEYGGMAKDLQFEAVSHVGGDSFVAKIGDKNHLFALDQGKTFAELTLER